MDEKNYATFLFATLLLASTGLGCDQDGLPNTEPRYYESTSGESDSAGGSGDDEVCEPFAVPEGPHSGCLDSVRECEDKVPDAPEACGEISCDLCVSEYVHCEDVCRFGGGLPGDKTRDEYCGEFLPFGP